jgi:transposase-like protein
MYRKCTIKIEVSGLSLRRTSERPFYFIKRNHVTICNWIQKYHPLKISTKSKRISEFIVDETLIKVGSEYIWLWVAIDAKSKEILAIFYLINPRKETCLLLKDSFRV